MRFFIHPGRQRLAFRLMGALLAASTALAIVVTTLLLAFDYRRELANINDSLSRVERSQLPSIANSLWAFDEAQLRLQLDGLLQLPGVRHATLTTGTGERFEVGKGGHDSLVQRFPVRHAPAGNMLLGQLEIGVSLDALYTSMARKALAILAATVTGTLLVAFAMLTLVRRWITRHLEHMAHYARSLQLDRLGEPLVLKRQPGAQPDELDHVATAFNDMTHALAAELQERARTEEELRRYRSQLEDLVTARTAELQQVNSDLVGTNKRLEQALTQLVQSEKMASIGVLAAGVAHEINNPLGFISANLGTLNQYVRDLMMLIETYETAEAALPPGSQQLDAILRNKKAIDLPFLRDDLADLTRETEEGLARVKKIVQDLKDFSHAGESEWQVSDLHKGLESTLNIAWNELKYKVELVKQYGDIPEIECLPSELNQVFMNLFVNAAQAMPARGQLRVSTGQADEGVWIEVADTGQGIAPEHLSRIFEPFFTTKPVGQGTGLGLALSYAIIQKHHGTLDVKSTVGVGTTFRIWLPLRQQSAPATVEP